MDNDIFYHVQQNYRTGELVIWGFVDYPPGRCGCQLRASWSDEKRLAEAYIFKTCYSHADIAGSRFSLNFDTFDPTSRVKIRFT